MTAEEPIEVDPSNAGQLAAWDGDGGGFWAAHADRMDRSIVGYHGALMTAAAISPTDQVLDVGCGAGQTSCDAALVAHAGSVLAIDLSSPMLEVARQRAAAAGLDNVRFLHGDAQVHPFEPAHFDVALSRTGCMFFADLPAAFANIARALRPGARLALLTWCPYVENEWIAEITTALMHRGHPAPPPPDGPGPFALSVPERIDEVLAGAGFGDIDLTRLEAGLCVGGDVDDAFAFVTGLSGWMMADHDEAGRREAIAALRASLERHLTADGVVYASAAWLITARR